MTDKIDMAIIGGGPAGYVAALRGRQLGLNVALVEKESIGGCCLNRGCIPTKSFLADVEGVHWMRRAVRNGILDREPRVRFSMMVKRKDEVVNGLRANLEKLLASSGVSLSKAAARIPEPGTVLLDSGEIIHAQNIVIATGSRSWIPSIPGADLPGVLTTREMLSIDKVPENLVIIGGGIIGQEFADIFSALGSKITVLEALSRLLSNVDTELARKYASFLPGRGVTTEVGVQVHAICNQGSSLEVVYERKGKEKTVAADVVLMATGRRPNLDECGIGELGIRVQNRALEVDRFLRTSVEGIYAAGDVVGGRMLAHLASYHGEIVAENIANRDIAVRDDIVPSCVFTNPQIAWAGLTEDEAKQSGRAFRTSVFSLTNNGKAQALGEHRGWLKLIEDSETGKLIGANFLGPNASELIMEITLALRKGFSAADVVEAIHPHPTLSEGVREAALGLLDGPIHAEPRVKRFP
jgi:dihydrolipoamide dehydrogenase